MSNYRRRYSLDYNGSSHGDATNLPFKAPNVTAFSYRKASSINRTKYQHLIFPVSSCNCICPIDLSQVLSRQWRCSWSRVERRCCNYILVINNYITYCGAAYIRGLDHLKAWLRTRLECLLIDGITTNNEEPCDILFRHLNIPTYH